MFYRWAHANDIVEVDPALNLPGVQIPYQPPLPAAPDDVVLDAFENATLAERAMVLLAATMGLRRTEIATLHPENRNDRTLRVKGKGNRVRELTLDELTHEYLLLLEHQQGPQSFYFPGRFGGHLHPATVYKWVKAHIGRDWTLHSCRRRAATVGYRETKDIIAVQRFLGHAHLSTTQFYVNVDAEKIAAITNATSLVHSSSTHRIAGSSGPNTVPTVDFLRDLAAITKLAREHGMEIRVR